VFESLILTKFHNPLTIGRLTQRPRLDKKLDESLSAGCRLVLVTAPAGFGKSTLISAWINQQTTHFSWLSLDRSDNDPKQFFRYLIGALQKIDPSLGSDQINRLQTADASNSEAVYADLMTSIVNETTTLLDPFILVLDDCHVLKNPLLLRLLNFLIDHQPPQMHLFLLTREDLPIPVSRLRVRRQIVEIRQADLQFSFEESEDFLRVGMGINQLSNNNLLVLHQRTEGWIAGLQLAVLSIKSNPNPENFIQSFAGSDRYILDYLMDEVFTHQTEENRNFLLAASILDRFCAPLCDSLLAEMENRAEKPLPSASVILEQLESSNLFLFPLDYQRFWFRFHHLFADLLRHSLKQIAPTKIPTLHRLASQWFEKNGLIHEAVKHAFLTEDWLYAAELVERHAWGMILHSQVGTVSEWCRVIPENIISTRPALCIFHSWALIIAFKKADFPEALIRINQAESVLDKIDREEHTNVVNAGQPIPLRAWVTGQLTLLRSFLLMAAPRKQADPQALAAFGQLACQQLPAEDITGISVGLLDICYASQARCDVKEAEKKFEHVIGVALSGGNYFGAIVAEYHRAHGLFVQGKLQEVIQFCQQKKKTYSGYFKDPIKELPAIALLDQALACALIEMNKLSEAEQYLRSSLKIGQWMPREELPGYIALARICAIRGDFEGVEESLRQLDIRWPDISYCTQAIRIYYDLIFHPADPKARKTAHLWVQSHPPDIGPDLTLPGIGPAWNDEADFAVYTIWAEIQIILGKPNEALNVIKPMLNIARKFDLFHRVINLSFLQAQAYYVLGQKESAWKALQVALSLVESNGYCRLPNQHPLLERLVLEAMKLGIIPHTIRNMLELSLPDFDFTQKINDPLINQQPDLSVSFSDGLMEPLSNREIEVLGLMALGLTNAEIAARLFLSPNTLKTHTQNIFGKLDVHSRIQAVNKARDLNLI
jgi:LuxR family maltose regulon positive regulatory protein